MGHITVDTEKLAQGLYKMHLELAPTTLALSIGMLDAKIMTTLERQLKERIPDEFYFAGDPLVTRDGKTFREGVIRKIVSKVLRLAKRDGILQC